MNDERDSIFLIVETWPKVECTCLMLDNLGAGSTIFKTFVRNLQALHSVQGIYPHVLKQKVII